MNLKNVYIDDYELNYEYNIDNIWKDYNLDIEYDISNILKDYNIDFEFKNVYITNENLNFENNVYELHKDYALNLESLVFANTDYALNLEVLRFEEKQVNVQSYVVPLAFKDNIIQVNINAFYLPALNFEASVPYIPTTQSANFESSITIDVEETLNTEYSVPYLWSDVNLSIELNTEELSHDFDLGYEFKKYLHR